MPSDIWTITAGGITQPADAWKVEGLTRSSESLRAGELKFRMPSARIDTAAVFPEGSLLTLKRNGVGWFSGQVTQVPRRGNPRGEELNYIVHDPWYDIERTPFQQQWVTTTINGGAVQTLTTTQSRVTLGQSLDGVQMNLGQILNEVLIYMLYATQGLAFPTTVVDSLLPAAPAVNAGTGATFQISTIMPAVAATTVPYFEVTDLKCGEIIRKLLRYVPDVVQWFDFTTSPPTLNFNHRSGLAPKTISVVSGAPTSGFAPVARYDLQVPW